MRIVFLDFSNLCFDACTVDHQALGGTESAQCYLSRSMAKLGHEVWLIGKPGVAGVRDGVSCLNLHEMAGFPRGSLDVAVSTGVPADARAIRPFLKPGGKLLTWVPHTTGQPPVEQLRDSAGRAVYDGLVFVSQWQRDDFCRNYGVEPERSVVMRNGISFAFESLFAPQESIVRAKELPPVLAYTSAPFRGLEVLLDAFGLIRAQAPGAILRVYSSMKTYLATPQKDRADYGTLYDRCARTAGVEYIGGIRQADLAQALRRVSVLAYSNTFAETSCIAAMEAMAAGCRVVTTEFGALPETTAGYARLVPAGRSRLDFIHRFAAETVAALQERESAFEATDAFLRRQVEYVNRTMSWHTRALEWTRWLAS